MTETESITRRQQRVLRAIRAAEGPTGATELARRLSVHPNTVRFHLDALEDAGAIERVAPAPAGRGRPPVLYRAVAGPGERRYEFLAGIFASQLAADEHGRARATEAGYAWGLEHADRETTGGNGDDSDDGDGDEPVRKLVGLLDDLGFAPRRADTTTVELLNCPFRETVAEHGGLICDMHAGLMRGALAGWNAPVDLAALEPFVTPTICRARLSRGDAR
ncbi:MarR family transcriptional regulator [Kocuria coralli]|uniref:MarR family transcriptional regulator n=1 Tax=Kocuria coralli TaxID=1461025 RepID=A0A5J5KY74_9MICC|nr:helix-turn-helix domain-containing protein [Kocuria coralli]KAA9393691.1 MarR family transcriptional regulator [Kocuria coralli]